MLPNLEPSNIGMLVTYKFLVYVIGSEELLTVITDTTGFLVTTGSGSFTAGSMHSKTWEFF